MRKKNVLIILLTALIFLSTVVLGASTVYRVNTVTVRAPVVSDEAKAEAEQLQALLTTAYDKQSIFFVDDALAKEIVAKFPYFNVTGFEKKYPNRLVVEITEETEVYAVRTADESAYFVLSAKGTILGVRSDYKNRSDGADNLLLKGLSVTGEKGATITGDDCIPTLFAFLQKVSASLGGIRRNIASVEVLRLASTEEETVFRLNTLEGVKIYVRNPSALTDGKAETAVNEYLSMSIEQRLKGMLLISDVDGSVIFNYHSTDELVGKTENAK